MEEDTFWIFSPIIFNIYRRCLIKKSLEGFGDLKKEENVILIVKYADELVLLAKEEALLNSIIAKLLWNGNKCRKKDNRNLEAISLSGGYDRLKPEENKEYFDFLVSIITNYSSLTRDINSSVAISQAAFNNRVPFTSKLDLSLRMKQVKCYIYTYRVWG